VACERVKPTVIVVVVVGGGGGGGRNGVKGDNIGDSTIILW